MDKLARGEIYKLDSKVVWFDYSRERPGEPGAFFHGTNKRIFESFYKKYSNSFFIVFLLGFPKTTDALVVNSSRFNEMFSEKNTDKKGDWKYSIHVARGKYAVKVWGLRDFDVSDSLHNYEFLGLTADESLSIKASISKQTVEIQGTAEPISVTPKSIGIDTHEAAQGVLLLLGALSGYETYTPDKSKLWNGRRLGELATILALPEFTYSHLLKFAREIDVIWFSQGYPTHCFEVEHTTNVRDGLLREFQISQATNSKFFIVGPEDQRTKFGVEVEGEPFRKIRNRYAFRSYSDLARFYDRSSTYDEARKQFGI